MAFTENEILIGLGLFLAVDALGCAIAFYWQYRQLDKAIKRFEKTRGLK